MQSSQRQRDIAVHQKALIALMSKWLGVAKSKIDLKSGSKSRLKTLAITDDSDELMDFLSNALEQSPKRCPRRSLSS